jgi:hypothetical protein
VQRALIAELIEDVEREGSHDIRETNIFLLGLRYFHGYIIVSKPTGSGVRVVYH